MAARKPASKKEAARKPTSKKPTSKKPTSEKPTSKKAARAVTRKAPGGARADKAEGAAAAREKIRKLPAPHRAMGELLDAIVAREVPDAKRAVKWGAPMWGKSGGGWFAAFGSFKNYAKINFFEGAQLDPPPPEGEGKGMRSINIPSMAEFDEKRIASWVRQAAALPGWGKT